MDFKQASTKLEKLIKEIEETKNVVCEEDPVLISEIKENALIQMFVLIHLGNESIETLAWCLKKLDDQYPLAKMKLRPDIAKKIIANIVSRWKTLKHEEQQSSLDSALMIANELPDGDPDKQRYVNIILRIKRNYRGFAI